MKRLFFLPVCLLAMFFSCKKSSSSGTVNNTISATVNDTAVKFNTSAMGLYQSTNGIYDLAITGYASTASNSNEIAISIGGTTPVVAGTYTDNGVGTDEVSIVYSIAGGTNSYAAMSNGTVTITSLTSTNVQGTFSGTLSLFTGSSANNTATVTNGTFNVAIQQ